MSAFTLPTPRHFRRNRRGASSLWWAISLLLHGSVFLALITLTPLKSLVVPKPLSTRQAEEERVERMDGNKVEVAAELIREQRTAELRSNVDDLNRILNDMVAVEKVKHEEFEKVTGQKMTVPLPMDARALEQLKAEAEAKRVEMQSLYEKCHQTETEASRLQAEAEAKTAQAKQIMGRESDITILIRKLLAAAQGKREEARVWEGKQQVAEKEEKSLLGEKNQKDHEAVQYQARANQAEGEAKRLGDEASRRQNEASDFRAKQQQAMQESGQSKREWGMRQAEQAQADKERNQAEQNAARLEREAGLIDAKARDPKAAPDKIKLEASAKVKRDAAAGQWRASRDLAATVRKTGTASVQAKRESDQKAGDANQLGTQAEMAETRAMLARKAAGEQYKQESAANSDRDKALQGAADKQAAASEKKTMQNAACVARKKAADEADGLADEVAKLETEYQALQARQKGLQQGAGEAGQRAERLRREAEDTAESARGVEMQEHDKVSRIAREKKRGSSNAHGEAVTVSGSGFAGNGATAAGIADLYNEARSMEDDVTETYRNIRAAQLAMIRNMSFADALKITDVAKPFRPDLDRSALEKAIRSGKDFVKYEGEIQAATQGISDMVNLAGSMRDLAVGLTEAGKEGMSISGDWTKAMTGSLAALETQSAASQGRGDVRDMTHYMADAYAVAGKGGSSGAGGSSGNGNPLMKGQERGENSGHFVGNIPPDVPQGASLPREISRMPNPFKWQDASLPGRKITRDGDPADWMFLDSWYVIGPFPNPARLNINKVFPPETIVNLDAFYEGMDGQMVHWNFIQVGTPVIRPPRLREYAIYYLYTEIYSDEPRDVWMAIGSDDQSKIWINGQMVWKSADILKGWNPDEGYRRVRLVKGINTILLRIENAWFDCAASVMVGLRSPP